MLSVITQSRQNLLSCSIHHDHATQLWHFQFQLFKLSCSTPCRHLDFCTHIFQAPASHFVLIQSASRGVALLLHLMQPPLQRYQSLPQKAQRQCAFPNWLQGYLPASTTTCDELAFCRDTKKRLSDLVLHSDHRKVR